MQDSIAKHNEATDIKDTVTEGIITPVKISKEALSSLGGTEITDNSEPFDITITGRGASTIRYTGKQNLFRSGKYSYYILSEEPAYYKEANVKDGSVTFGKIKGSQKNIGTLYVSQKAGEAHHDFSPCITLYTSTETLTEKVLGELKAIIATDSDGKEYGLTTLSNFFWGKKQIGFKAPASDDEEKNYYPQHALVGKTVKKLTFITESAVYYTEDIISGTTVTDSTTKVVTFTPNEDTAFVIENLQAK